MCRIQVSNSISPIPEHLAHYTFTNEEQITEVIKNIRQAQDQLADITYTENNLASLGYEFKKRIKPILDQMKEKLEYRKTNFEIAHLEIRDLILEAISKLTYGRHDLAVNRITHIKDQILHRNHRYSRQLSQASRENIVSVLKEIRIEMANKIKDLEENK